MFSCIVFDTETTSLVNRRQEADHPSQPHVVQLAAILYDRNFREVARLDTIIRPEGWVLEPGVLAGLGMTREEAKEKKIYLPSCDIHGISQDKAEAEGIPIRDALAIFDHMAAEAEFAVAHNTSFDLLALGAEYHRLDWVSNIPDRTICTMKSTTELCKLKGRYGFKWPTLMELHEFLFGEKFDGAHGALEDVRACARCYIELKNRGHDEWCR